MIKEDRFEFVRLMHDTMCDMNNEDAYFAWIWIMPDCPTREDLEWFAEDEKEFEELKQTFIKLLERYAKDGLYRPSDDVIDFVAQFDIPIDILR